MSKLIIAEKPSVAKSIASALGASSRADGFYEGNGLLVSWCVGHLVSPMDAGGYDERFKKWRYDDLPILPEPFRYVLAPGKEDAFENLRALMDRPDVDTIVNACDAGREGELIFRLVYEMAGCRKPVLRLWISSMEDSAIREGFSDLLPGTDYEVLYQSALCRQKADWLVGINATRLFSVLYHRTLSVGRVQTPTLAMLAERDTKITLFHKEKYHLLRLKLDGAEAVSEKFTDPAEAEQAAAMCKGAAVTCTSVTKEQKKEQPPKLYDLTTLQREANRLFGYTAKQTLDCAQSLYEKKLLTYPRTDSRYLTSDMAETASCVIHLAANVPPFDGISNFFPLVEAMISDKEVSDHHAIIPTMEVEKADIKALPLGERNLFLLVCCKLLCASAEPYVYEAITAIFDCGGHSFTAKGKHILSEGWREIDRIFRTSLKEKPADGDGGTLPDFTEGQTFDGAKVSVTEHFTQPPKPYTEDTLLSAMENYLPSEIDKFKDATGYEEFLDFDPAEVKAALDDPEKSHADEMLSAAEKVASEKMTVLVVEPMKEPYVKEIDPDLHSLQAEVGGDIGATYPYSDPVALVCNDEGKLIGLDLNRGLRDENGEIYDIVAGTFLVVGLGEEDFASLSPELIQKYTEQFKTPERFMQINGNIVVLPVPAEKQDLAFLPDRFETGERVQTPRGSFQVTAMSREQMEAAGYGVHHISDDRKYLIMGNGTRAFAVAAEQPEKDNPLRTAEMTLEDDYGMIDGVINNGRRGEELEKAQEHAEQTKPEKPSIRERLEDAKRECAEHKPPEGKKPGRDVPEHDCL